jgi:hypothetical protein
MRLSPERKQMLLIANAPEHDTHTRTVLRNYINSMSDAELRDIIETQNAATLTKVVQQYHSKPRRANPPSQCTAQCDYDCEHS